MAQNENTLTDSLAAAQRRLAVTASTNPIGLSEGLVRQLDIPGIDFAAETAQALDTLETEVVNYRDSDGKPNMELINARQAVVLLDAQLEEARPA